MEQIIIFQLLVDFFQCVEVSFCFFSISSSKKMLHQVANVASHFGQKVALFLHFIEKYSPAQEVIGDILKWLPF